MISYAGRDARTVNFLKTVYFDHPQWVPASMWFLPATWMMHRERLEEVLLAHPKLYPGWKKGQYNFDTNWGVTYEVGQHTDCWGVTWDNVRLGMSSTAVGHPLADWEAFDSGRWKAPDPEKDHWFGPRNFDADRERLRKAREARQVAEIAPLNHGFVFLLLADLRGYEEFMVDVAMGEPRLDRLIEAIESYELPVIRKYLEMGAEQVTFGEDLGIQTGLPISPAAWRRYIKPTYRKLFAPCRDADAIVYLHTDGNILDIIPDLIECGVNILNPQIRPNTAAGLRQVARGKVALHQDLDRQLFPFATPRQLEEHVGQVVEELYLPEGGLSLSIEIAPDVPLENIDALATAIEKTCRLPDPKDLQ